jgi:short-subunit dehydrogenase
MTLPYPTHERTALVTGASAGIGAEVARELASRGHHLTLVARRRERLEELAAEIAKEHDVETAVDECDLGDAEARHQLIAKLGRRKRGVAVLVNNAGFATYGSLWETPADREREEVRLNVEALHDLTLAFLPGMVRHGYGAILNVGSTAGFQPLPGNSTYAASKAFVNSFSESLHAELAGTGVSCTVLCPGPVATEFAEVSGIGYLEEDAPGFVFASAGDVARAAVNGMDKGKRVVMPRPTDAVQGALGRYTPRSVLLPVVRRFGNRFF